MAKLSLTEIKLVLKKEKLNFKPELNGTKDSLTFIDEFSKVKLRGKIVRSFNEGEVHHWPLLNHENVAKLIDILCIREDAYIYLTVDHEMTLKNIIHDENFVYNSRCFDRKRSYAKGIFSGLSYLHGKSLTLMNLCDDNILISTTDDRAIITNFDHLTILRRTEKSRLQVPEMYLAPETEKGEFDASKAEMWASGVLMLDMFLAHMVPWAIVNYTAKKVMQIVDKISIDLLQAANAGSIVSAADLEKFRTFLKCFFKKNPQERIPAKYASIASFLLHRDKYIMLGDSYESIAYSECKNYSNLNTPDEGVTICLNPSYDPSYFFTSSSTKDSEMSSTNDADSYVSKTKIKRSALVGKNKTKIDDSLSETSKKSSTVENKETNSISSSNKFVAQIANTDLTSNFQKISKSFESIKESAKSVTALKYNYYQTRSLSFIIPEESYSNANPFEEESCDSNNKLLVKQPIQSDFNDSDLNLNWLFNNNYIDETKSNANSNVGSNTVVERRCSNAVTSKSLTEILDKWHVQIDKQVKQSSPGSHEYNVSLPTPEKNIVKSQKNSNAPILFHTSKSLSVVSKLLYLRKCFYSIQTHQKVYISKEFQRQQRKIIKEYQSLLLDEYSQWRQMLREILSKNQQDMSFQTRETKHAVTGTINNFKSQPGGKVKASNIITVRRKDSYYRAIENSMNDKYRKWEATNQITNKNPKEERKKNNYDPGKKIKSEYSTAIKCDKKPKEEHVDGKKIEMMKQYEQWKRTVKSVNDINRNSAMRPKEIELDQTAKIETVKQPELYKLKQMKKYDSIKDEKNRRVVRPNSTEIKDEKKNKKKQQEINPKIKPEKNRKKVESEHKKKLSKQKAVEKLNKKDKKQDDSKRSRFFTLCPGGTTD